MASRERIRSAGLAAALGGALAVLVAPLLSTAYHRAPAGAGGPDAVWGPALAGAVPDLFGFGAPAAVYRAYGLLATLALAGALAGLVALRAWIDGRDEYLHSRQQRRVGVGLGLGIAGVAGLFALAALDHAAPAAGVDPLGGAPPRAATVAAAGAAALGLAVVGVVGDRSDLLPRGIAALAVAWGPLAAVLAAAVTREAASGVLLALGVAVVPLGVLLYAAPEQSARDPRVAQRRRGVGGGPDLAGVADTLRGSDRGTDRGEDGAADGATGESGESGGDGVRADDGPGESAGSGTDGGPADGADGENGASGRDP